MNFKTAVGCYPTMITPYNADGTVDFEAVDALVDWYWQNGCDGIFAVCQSSEIFYLSVEERAALAARVRVRADMLASSDKSRKPLCIVASGHISSDHDMQAAELNAVAASHPDALILITNRFDIDNTCNSNWIKDAEKMLSHLPADIPLGLYECPKPYKRLLNSEILDWCLSTGRFKFIKDTCCSPELLSERCKQLSGTGLLLFNANAQTLLQTLRDGGAGYCGVMANFHPRLYSWLGRNYDKCSDKAVHLSELLSMAAFTEALAYPCTAKYHLSELEGIAMDVTARSRDCSELTAYHKHCIQQMYNLTRETEMRLGLR